MFWRENSKLKRGWLWKIDVPPAKVAVKCSFIIIFKNNVPLCIEQNNGRSERTKIAPKEPNHLSSQRNQLFYKPGQSVSQLIPGTDSSVRQKQCLNCRFDWKICRVVIMLLSWIFSSWICCSQPMFLPLSAGELRGKLY